MANRGLAAESALYLYGISPADESKPARITSPGIDGVHAVQAVPCGDFLCWISGVDRDSFSAEMNRNMDNLEWLALHGVRHQQVVAEIAAKQTIVPARFGTVFSGEQALLKNVQGRKSALKKVFTRISGADEWGVKVFAEPQPAAVIPAAAQPGAAVPHNPSGKEYLQAKAAQLKRQPVHDNEGLREFAAALEKVARDSAPTGKISGAQPDLLWQATFLVARDRRKQWDKALQQFVKQWGGLRRIEVNGPWPPYSFASDAE